MSFVREHFPHLLDDYTKRYAKADFVDAAYHEKVAAIARAACRKHGLAQRSTAALLSRALGAQGTAMPPRKAPQPVRTADFSSRIAPAQGSLFAIA